jgi:hypothetical protein
MVADENSFLKRKAWEILGEANVPFVIKRSLLFKTVDAIHTYAIRFYSSTVSCMAWTVNSNDRFFCNRHVQLCLDYKNLFYNINWLVDTYNGPETYVVLIAKYFINILVH